MSTIRVTTEASSTVPPPTPSPPLSAEPLAESIDSQPEHDDDKSTEDSTSAIDDDSEQHIESVTHNDADNLSETEAFEERIEETTTIDQQLRKISDEIDRLSQANDANGSANSERHSFLSLNDLMKSLRTADKPDKRIIPQIDSAYSNTMRVLGETASIIGGIGDDTRKTIDLRHTNRAL